MDAKEKERLEAVLEYLNKCLEQKEVRINSIMKGLARSKVTKISQQKLFMLASSHFFTPSGIRTFCNPAMGKRQVDGDD